MKFKQKQLRMKKMLTLITMTVASFLINDVSAQMRKIPAAVTEAFKTKYPDAEGVEWSDKITVFMARFREENIDYEARFNTKGEWQNTETLIPNEDLPEAVNGGFEKSKFAEWEIGSVHKIMLPGDQVQYRIQAVKNDLQKKNLLFNSKGRLLRDNITL